MQVYHLHCPWNKRLWLGRWQDKLGLSTMRFPPKKALMRVILRTWGKGAGRERGGRERNPVCLFTHVISLSQLLSLQNALVLGAGSCRDRIQVSEGTVCIRALNIHKIFTINFIVQFTDWRSTQVVFCFFTNPMRAHSCTIDSEKSTVDNNVVLFNGTNRDDMQDPTRVGKSGCHNLQRKRHYAVCFL